MPVLRVVAGNEILQVLILHGVCFQGEVHIGSQIIYPDSLSPWSLACRLSVEEEHVCLHALGIEYACRQPQEGVDVTLMEELPSNSFSSTTLKEHVVRDNNRCLAVHLQERFHVLHENGLLV